MSQLKIRPMGYTFEVIYADEPVPQVCLLITGDDGGIVRHWFTPSDARALARELVDTANTAEDR